MERVSIEPRSDWRDKVEPLGMVFDSTDGEPYWCETAYYRLSSGEVDLLEAATNELHRLCVEAAQYVIDHNRFSDLAIPASAVPAIVQSWERDDPSLYGRFDLGYDGHGSPPRLLEYNADTPTALLEAAVIQWYWHEDRFPETDQFNSIWGGLIESWKWMNDQGRLPVRPVYFAHERVSEDLMTVAVLRDTAEQAGFSTNGIHMDEIGWDSRLREFVDLQGNPMRSIFKLYPWEWMLQEPFGRQALQMQPQVAWIEPVWKMLFSNKGLLAVLWELFPGHPNLLEAHLDSPRNMPYYVRKPLLSREGENVMVVAPDGILETPGDYGAGPVVYQALATIPNYNGNRPVLGSWVIGGEARGIGIREADGPVTDNLSRFVPHLFTE